MDSTNKEPYWTKTAETKPTTDVDSLEQGLIIIKSVAASILLLCLLPCFLGVIFVFFGLIIAFFTPYL